MSTGPRRVATSPSTSPSATASLLVEQHESLRREIEVRIERFPSLPTAVAEIEQVASDPDSSLADFENAIVKDQAVTAKLLRLSNSAFYRRSRAISTIREAVSTIGAKSVKSLVLAAATAEMMDKKLDMYGYDRRGLWKHSFSTALCGRSAARFLEQSTLVQEEVFVAGLLHDIGKLVLEPLLAKYSEGRGNGRGGATISEEMSCLGLDHAQVGLLIVAKWKLPPQIGEAIVFHHEPQKAREFPAHVSILTLANDVVRSEGIGLLESAGVWNEADTSIRLSGIDGADAKQIRADLVAEIPEVRALCEQLAAN